MKQSSSGHSLVSKMRKTMFTQNTITKLKMKSKNTEPAEPTVELVGEESDSSDEFKLEFKNPGVLRKNTRHTSGAQCKKRSALTSMS